MSKLFGTDGVRGIANSELTIELAFQLGKAGAYILGKNNHKPKFVIGKDTRISGDMLESALIAGICSLGGQVISVDVVPTPAVAILTRHFNADAGIVISASHNPVEFNGIKFLDNNGYKLPDEVEDKIEDLVISHRCNYDYPTGNEVGFVTKVANGNDIYIDYLLKTIDTDFKDMKILLDCANGASFISAPKIFKQLGADIKVIADKPDGTNINLNCGSTHLDKLQSLVIENEADLGLAFDGDADRLLAVDNLGNIVDGDKIMNICARSLKKEGKLKNDTLVVTVMSNMGLDKALEEVSCCTVKTKVGDRYVLETMKKEGYNIGGEQSGHIIFLDYNTTGDGLLSALQLTQIIKKEGKTLSELANTMKVYPQVLVNAKVSNNKKYDYLKDEVIQNEIEKVENHFHGKGRVLIRPSGTEPLVRVMIEGENQEELDTIANDLAELIHQRLS